MRVPINLSSNPYENLRPLYAAVGAAAVALLALASLVIWQDWQTRGETRTLTGQIRQINDDLEKLQGEQQRLEQGLRTPEVQRIREHSAFLNSLISRKGLSWTQIFMDLEKILPQQVQITSIRPSLTPSQQAELNLTVAAAEVGPLVQFLKNLESSPRFGPPTVESQRYPTARAANTSIVLELSAQYDSLAPGPEPAAAETGTSAKPAAFEGAAVETAAP
ncbi:MAG TPA: PilN domain-containing protein, partial [Candidatus Glassbacteria bacterium]|nr:PilN domain-containing protein [Candidatus Glassbacteria bacterium]